MGWQPETGFAITNDSRFGTQIDAEPWLGFASNWIGQECLSTTLRTNTMQRVEFGIWLAVQIPSSG